MIFALLGPVAYLVPKGLWILIVLILASNAGTLRRLTAGDLRQAAKEDALFFLVPAYALLSSLWAVEPATAAVTSLKITGYVFAAIILVIIFRRMTDQERRSILVWSAAGLIVAQGVVWIDLALEGGLSGIVRSNEFLASYYNRGASLAVCVVVPVTIGLWRYSLRPLATGFFTVTLISVFLLESEAAKLALVAAVLVFFLVLRFRRLFWPFILTLAGFLIAMPAIFGVQFSDRTLCTICEYKCSAAHRLVIYNYSSQRILEKPVFGWGMDSARSIPSGVGMAYITGCSFSARADGHLQIGNKMPLHPHNASLQAWLELGAVGVILLIISLTHLLRGMTRNSFADHNRPLIAAVCFSVFIIFNVSFGFWQGWLMFGMVFLCALMCVATRVAPAAGPSPPTAS